MRNFKKHLLSLSLALLLSASSSALAQSNVATQQSQQQSLTKIGVIDTRRCLEDSKLSKHERITLEKMKSQMESLLKEKQKALTEIENKLRDEDYMDSLSDDSERELKHKRKVLMEEGGELSRQFTENLEMTNMKIIQGIVEAIGIASKDVVTEMNSRNQLIDIVLSSEACTYFLPNLNITDKVLAKMDELFEIAQKNVANKK